MAAVNSPTAAPAPIDRTDSPGTDEALDTPRRPWWRRYDAIVAVAGYLGLVAIALTHATSLLEPDDFAYRASIVALSEGHVLLTTAQYRALVHQLASFDPAGIAQWHHLASGRWISEKNPGYPFFAVAFYFVHALRLAPLFYGALGAFGLYHGARAWRGGWAGAAAVWLYSFSGAALVFAWRSTMPSFTDASLIAAGTGGLVWAMLRVGVSQRRRCAVGLLSFLALDGAVFIRYTDVAPLLVALAAVVALHRAARIGRVTLALWLAVNAAFAVGLGAFNLWAYGGVTSTGYSAGEISFSLSAIGPNLRTLPRDLAITMPAWVLAAVALGWVLVRWLRGRTLERRDAVEHDAVECEAVERGAVEQGVARRDVAVALALALAWLAPWAWYFAYTWTAQMGGGGDPVHLIRFYLPAIGPVAMLGAWALSRWHTGLALVLLSVVVVMALLSFHEMAGGAGAGASPGSLPGATPAQAPAGAARPHLGAPPGTTRPPKGAPPIKDGPNGPRRPLARKAKSRAEAEALVRMASSRARSRRPPDATLFS